MLTVFIILVIVAFIATIVGAMGKCPWWVPVIILCFIELLNHIPLGK